MHAPRLRWPVLADLPISAKVGLAPGLILLILVLLSLVSVRTLDAAGARLQEISERAFPAYQRAAETKDAVNAIQTALQHLLSVAANESDPARVTAVAAPVRDAIARAADALQRFQSQDGVSRAAGAALGAAYEAYRSAATEVMDAASQDPGTASMMMGDTDERFAALARGLDRYQQQADQASRALSVAALRTAERDRVMLLLGAVLAIVSGIGILLVIARAISRPILGLTVRMSAMADDELERAVPELGRRDEIGAIARAVDVLRRNGLIARQHAADREREQAAKLRRQVAMDHHMSDFGSAIAAVMASLAQSADGMRKAAAAMTAAAATVSDQAGATAEGAARSSLDLASVAAAIEQLTSSVDEIARQVGTAADVAHAAVRSADAGQQAVHGLAEAASQIGEVAHLIRSIAEQTNLLALNATIEAARAGEAGKGFAVVAGEVKSLAAQTASATANIDHQVQAIRRATEASLAAMTEIGSIVVQVDHVASAIAAAVEQQTATTRDLAASVQAVSSATDRTAHAMQAVSGAAGEAGSVSRAVLQASAIIGTDSEKLSAEVDRFLGAVRAEEADRPARLDSSAAV